MEAAGNTYVHPSVSGIIDISNKCIIDVKFFDGATKSCFTPVYIVKCDISNCRYDRPAPRLLPEVIRAYLYPK